VRVLGPWSSVGSRASGGLHSPAVLGAVLAPRPPQEEAVKRHEQLCRLPQGSKHVAHCPASPHVPRTLALASAIVGQDASFHAPRPSIIAPRAGVLPQHAAWGCRAGVLVAGSRRLMQHRLLRGARGLHPVPRKLERLCSGGDVSGTVSARGGGGQRAQGTGQQHRTGGHLHAHTRRGRARRQ